jgi:hypothetical protein
MLQRPRQHRRGKFDEVHAVKQRTSFLAMLARAFAHEARPDFILEKAAGNERLLPQRAGGLRSSAKQVREATEVSR